MIKKTRRFHCSDASDSSQEAGWPSLNPATAADVGTQTSVTNGTTVVVKINGRILLARRPWQKSTWMNPQMLYLAYIHQDVHVSPSVHTTYFTAVK